MNLTSLVTVSRNKNLKKNVKTLCFRIQENVIVQLSKYDGSVDSIINVCRFERYNADYSRLSLTEYWFWTKDIPQILLHLEVLGFNNNSAHLVLVWTPGVAICCIDSITFCPKSRTRPDAPPPPSTSACWYISCQNFAPLRFAWRN